MCVVSMVGDSFNDRWREKFPGWEDSLPGRTIPSTTPSINPFLVPPAISRREFDELKREVEILKDLLKRAKEYDRKNNEPFCEKEDKVALLRRVAEMVGVDLKDVL